MSRLTDRLDAWYDRQRFDTLVLVGTLGFMVVLPGVAIGLVFLLAWLTGRPM